MAKNLLLCGTMFGLRTYRHRYFESSVLLMALEHPRHTVRTSTRKRKAGWESALFVSVTGHIGSYCGSRAMDIDWMSGKELSQAIPPAYSEYVGGWLFKAVGG
jgi:DNA (cytosine-5)-methyltransferase 1